MVSSSATETSSTRSLSAAVPSTVYLKCQADSKITAINLYSGRAEISRRYKFSIKTGKNTVIIRGLPMTLDKETIRVDGHGNASIHDVAISRSPMPERPLPPAPISSEQSNGLARRHNEVTKALESARQSRLMLKNYLYGDDLLKLEISKLGDIMDHYEALTRKADNAILDLEQDLTKLDAEIKASLNSGNDGAVYQSVASWQVTILMEGKEDGEVRIALKYIVSGADWTPSYNVHVDTQAEKKNINVTYKASITQNTGEDWTNAPLTLETVTPTRVIDPPSLGVWNLGVRAAPVPVAVRGGHRYRDTAYSPDPRYGRRSRSRSRSRTPPRRRRPSLPRIVAGPATMPPIMSGPVVPPIVIPPARASSNKGSIAATFLIPAPVNIPSDEINHSVTVAELSFAAQVSWYAVPSQDTRVFLRAKIKNESDYLLTPGMANIYVDGSFVAYNTMPSVSPQEEFDCPLGLDPALRITYHPLEKKASQSAFYTLNKNHTQAYNQRITVVNNKSTQVSNLKIVHRIPVSTDARIQVKLVSPSLTLPVGDAKPTKKPIKVGDGVIAQWDGVDELIVDETALGKEGKLNWILQLAPRKTVGLTVQFEVSYPTDLDVYGL